MQELEKILEEMKESSIMVATSKEHYIHPQDGRFVEEVVLLNDVEEIIRKHMNDNSGTYGFDFSSVDSFDCPCGRRYVHIWRPPKLEFCPECKVKVENDRTDICPECQRKLREYEEKYHCIVDIGVRGLPGPPGDAESKP